MEGKKTSFILICIVAALTLVVVLLSAYIFIDTGLPHELMAKITGEDTAGSANNISADITIPAGSAGETGTTGTGTSSLYQISTVKRPSKSALATKKLYDDKVIYNLKSTNGENSVIQVSVVIEFYKKVKGIKNVEEKINSFESDIKELVGTYFQNMTINEVKDPNTKLKAKRELADQINKLLNSDEENYYKIVNDVIFEDWFYQ